MKINSESKIQNLKFAMAFAMALLAAPAAMAAVTVSNVTAAQREGTKLVDIVYDVSSTATNAVTVSLVVSNGAASVTAPSVTGAVGEGVATGTGKCIVWDAGADWAEQVAAGVVFSIKVDDGAGPVGMVSIPGGTNNGTDPDFGAYSLTVEAFFMDATEVTKAKWDEVYTWAVAHNYSFSKIGSGKAQNHPVHTVSWYDCVKWCNARSEMDGRTPCYNLNDWSCNLSANGYRLPTATEWEYAARGGLSGKRFPWGDTINHADANYCANGNTYSYDTSPYTVNTFHPTYATLPYPFSSPAGAFAPNGYGLYDMAGNMWEWCNDATGASRVIRGGCWNYYANSARCGTSSVASPSSTYHHFGFRTVCR